MIERELSAISEDVLRELIADGASEGKTLEFKRVLELNDPDAKLKFLRGIASFANAAGGDMVFGIAATKEGKAESLAALVGFNPDRDTLRIRDIIRMNTEPRTILAEFRPVELSSGGCVLVIRIRKSLSGAHLVTHKDDFKFFTRDHGGRRMMEVPEIRAAFTFSESIAEKINRFRLERLAKLVAGETPHPVTSGAAIVIHVCPFRSFEAGVECNLQPLRDNPSTLPPLSASGWSSAEDFDGFFTYAGAEEGVATGYCLVFRNGCLEVVDKSLLAPRVEKTFLPSIAYEERILQALPKWTALLKTVGAEPPALVMMSLLGVRGYWMYVDPSVSWHGARVINRDELILPAGLTETLDIEASGRTPGANVFDLFRPMFNTVWNACGYPRSINFDEKGNWNPRR